MTPDLLDALKALNAQLDARAVLERIGHHPESIAAVGSRIKCFCPVHGEQGFRSLTVDPERGSCMCMVRTCPASSGISLLDLYSLSKKMQPLAAAVVLAREFSIPMDGGGEEAVLAHFLAQADAAIASGDAAGAAAALDSARQISPDNPSLALRVAKLKESTGDTTGAAEAFLAAALMASGAGRHEEALECLRGGALRLDPGHLESLKALRSSLMAHRGAPGELAAATLDLAIAHQLEGHHEAAVPLLRELLAGTPDDWASRRLLGRSLACLGAMAEASTTYEEAVGVLLAAGEHDEAAEVCEEALRLEPGSTDWRRRLAKARALAGDPEAYIDEMESLARASMERGNFAEAEAALGEVLEVSPCRESARRQQIELLRRQGQHAQAAAAQVALAEHCHEGGDDASFGVLLEEIDFEHLESVDALERLAECCHQSGRNEVAARLCLEVARRRTGSAPEELVAACFRVFEIGPGLRDQNMGAAKVLADAGLTAESERLLIFNARERLEAGELGAAHEFVAEAEHLPEYATSTAELAVDVLLALKDDALIVPAIQNLVPRLLREGRAPRALELVERSLELSPKHPRLLEPLAGIYLTMDRRDDALGILDDLFHSRKAPRELSLRAGEQAVDLDPDNLELRIELAGKYEQSDHLEEALRHFRRGAEALVAAGRHAEARDALAHAARLTTPPDPELVHMQADVAIAMGEPGEAVEFFQGWLNGLMAAGLTDAVRAAFEETLEKLPTNAEFREFRAGWLAAQGDAEVPFTEFMALGEAALAAGQGVEALRLLERATDIRSDDVRLHQMLAEARFLDGDEEGFGQELELAAEIAEGAGDLAAARESLERFGALLPLAEHHLARLAQWCEKLGDAAAAVACLLREGALRGEAGEHGETLIPLYEDALRLEPGNTDAIKQLADCCADVGDAPRAVAGYLELNRLHEQRGDAQAASEALLACLVVDPGNLEARRRQLESSAAGEEYRSMALALAHDFAAADDVESAAAILDKLRAAHPGDVEVLHAFAECALRQGRQADAIAALSEVAAIQESSGALDEAIIVMRRLSELEPESLTTREHLASLLRRADHLDEAIENYLVLLGSVPLGSHDDTVDNVISELVESLDNNWERFARVTKKLEELGAHERAVDAAERFLERAEAGENHLAALPAARYLVERAPDSPFSREMLARVLLATGDNEEAAGAFRRAATLSGEQGDHAEEVRLARAACEAMPGQTDLRRELMVSLLAAAMGDEAVQVAGELVAEAVERDDAEFGLSVAMQLIDALPDSEPARDLLILSLLEAHREDDAIAELREVARLSAGTSPERARLALEKVLDLRPDALDALNELRTLVVAMDGEGAARPLRVRSLNLLHQSAADSKAFTADARKLLAEDEDYHPLRRRFAELLHERGLVEEAAENLSRAAKAAKAAGEAEAASEILKLSLEWNPDDPGAHTLLAEEWAAAGDTEAASEAFRSAAELHRARGDSAARAACLHRLAELQPDAPELWAELAALHEELGATDEAVAAYGRLAQLREAEGRPDDAIAALRASQSVAHTTRAAEEIVRLLLVGGDEPAAIGELRLLAERCRDSEPDTAARCARQAIELGCHDAPVLQLAVDLHDPAKEQWAAWAAELKDLHLAAGDHATAAAVLERICEAQPAETASRLELASCFHAQGRTDHAVALLSALAAERRTAKKPRDAEEAIVKALEWAPRDEELQMQHWELLAATKRQDDAAAGARAFIASKLEEGASPEELAPLLAKFRQYSRDARVAVSEILSMLHEAGHHDAAATVLDDALADAIEDGKSKEALSLLQTAEGLYPDKIEFVERRAQLRESSGDKVAAAEDWSRLAQRLEGADTARALACWEEAIRLSPGKFSFRQSQLSLMKRTGATKEELVSRMRELSSLFEEFGNTPAAMELGREILLLDPSDLKSLEALAEHLYDEGDSEEALQRFGELARLAAARGDDDAALDAWERVRELAPGNTEALRELLALHERQGRRERAVEIAHILCAQCEQDGDANAAFELWQKIAALDPKDKTSRQHLLEGYKGLGDQTSGATILRELYQISMDADDLAEAAQWLHKVEELDSESAETSELLGHLYVRMRDEQEGAFYLLASSEKYFAAGEEENALRLSDEVRDLQPHTDGLWQLRARILRQLGRRDEAVDELMALADEFRTGEQQESEVDTLRHILDFAPDRLDVRERLALALSDLDLSEDAVDQFLLLSHQREAAGDLQGSLDSAMTARSLLSDSPVAHQRIAHVAGKLGDKAHAAKAHAWLADYHETNLEFNSALEHLWKVMELDGETPALLLRAAKLSSHLGDKSRTSSLFSKVAESAKLSPNSTVAKEALVALYLQDPTDMEAFARLCESCKGSEDPSTAVEAALQGVRMLVDGGEIETAREVEEAGLALAEDATAYRLELAGIYESAGIPEIGARVRTEVATAHRAASQWQAALDEVDRALKVRPGDLAALELRFRLLLDLERREEALVLAPQVVELLRTRGSMEQAVETCRHWVRLRPAEIEPREKLVAILRKVRGEPTLADELRDLADLHLAMEDHERAVAVLKELIALKPDDTRARIYYIDTFKRVGSEEELIEDYLKLAEIHSRHGAVVEATRVYERLLALAPDMTAPREQFIEFLMEQSQATRAITESYGLADLYSKLGEARKAVRVLERIGIHADAEPEYHVHLGRAHQRTAARGMAIMEYRRAAELHAQRRNFIKQSEVFQELLEVDPQDLEVRQMLIDSLLKSNRERDAHHAMEELAQTYRERGLPDLAEAEYRKLLQLDSNRPQTWKSLFSCVIDMGREEELVPAYLGYADTMARRGEVSEAMQYYDAVIKLDPANIQARRRYIEEYPRIGKLENAVDDMLELANLLVDRGEIEEAASIFEKVMTLDPKNELARDGLSQTQARLQELRGVPTPPSSATAPDEMDYSDSHLPMPGGPISPGEFLDNQLLELDREEAEDALEEVVRNYRNILAVNAQNAVVRIRLADVLEQMHRYDEMLEQLALASETLFNKGDLAQCVTACERYLKTNPRDQRVRERLSKSVLKRDAFKALESAIIFTDRPDRPGVDTD